MPLDTILAIAGAVSALLLIAGLIAGIVSGEGNRMWRIWPAPPVGLLKSFVFWTLFRTLECRRSGFIDRTARCCFG